MIISRTEPSLFQRSSLRFTTPSLGSIFSKTQRRSIKFHSRWSKLRLILTWEQRQASCTHVIRRLHLRQTLPVTNHTLSFSRSFAIRSSLSLSPSLVLNTRTRCAHSIRLPFFLFIYHSSRSTRRRRRRRRRRRKKRRRRASRGFVRGTSSPSRWVFS